MGVIAWPGDVTPGDTTKCCLCLAETPWREATTAAWDAGGQRFACSDHLTGFTHFFAQYLTQRQAEEEKRLFNMEYGDGGYEQNLY